MRYALPTPVAGQASPAPSFPEAAASRRSARAARVAVKKPQRADGPPGSPASGAGHHHEAQARGWGEVAVEGLADLLGGHLLVVLGAASSRSDRSQFFGGPAAGDPGGHPGGG